ncbi:MAG: hypothetical protein GEV03_18055 [Streptosporangiales bacterium]|nr:hypothetical protein [Streptosporangiales bacterium]
MTEPERRLWAAYPAGTWVELGADLPAEDAGPERTVRAEVIAALLLGACDPEPGRVQAVRLRGARVTGVLDVSGGTVGCALRLKECRLEEAPDFDNAQTRQIRMTDCRMPGFGGGGLRADGYLSLSGSVIDGQLRLPRAQLAEGLRLNGTRISNPGNWALFSGALSIEGGTFARDADITGAVRLVGARMGGGVFLQGATLRNPGGYALIADSVVVEDAMECSQGFTAEGTVRLRGARINGTLSFDQAALIGGDRALRLGQAQIEELILTPRQPIQGAVSLVYAHIGVLLDDVATWPKQLRLNGCTYQSLRGRGIAGRIAWVSRDPEGFRPQPYEQLAAWYRRDGNDNLARKTLLAKQRARRATLGRIGRLGGYLLDWTVGYGYRAWLAAVWLALLTAVGTTVFGLEPPRSLRGPDERPHFHALVYTLDLMVPFGAFGQREAWDPTGWTQWVAYALIVSGWILATALVAGVTRVLRPN